ncbi:MAG: hypothetical protein A2Y95_01980 [Deltaproteobacteria bacterium RBG_13_65_10]|nr:MAG: hypothetical protein A2Y95_01980 [Deltaproteobacteria bacterium RBG_13_65_10]
MHVADHVEGPPLRPLDHRWDHLHDGRVQILPPQNPHLVEALIAQMWKRAGELLGLSRHDPLLYPPRAGRVPRDASRKRDVEHEQHRPAVLIPRDGEKTPARGARERRAVGHGEASAREAPAHDRVQQGEGLWCGALVGLIVGHHGATGVA